MSAKPNAKKEEMRRRIFAGARLQLGRLSKEELEALYPLLVGGEAEIIRPVAVRKLPKW